MLDFMYAMIAGFAVYGAIGYLQIMDHPTYSKNSSVSLTFIAIPVMASLSENTGILYVFFLMLFFSGIGCSAGFAQSLVQNISDGFEISQFKASFMVCLVGVSFSTLLCTNFGWVLFDMFDH
jgi:SNF family Na+-dependent transporter